MKRTAIRSSTKPMKRSTPLRASQTPMNRAGTETLRARHQDDTSTQPPKPKRTGLRSKGPRMTPIRRSARGEECTLRIPGVCNRDKDTVVWCHSNRAEHGKGGALKAKDEHGCYGCSKCHQFYDGGYVYAGWTRADVEAEFDRASNESREMLQRKGLLHKTG